MLSTKTLTCILVVLTGTLAAPSQARDATDLTGIDEANAVVTNWITLLASNADSTADTYLTSDYQESSASLYFLNTMCPQNAGIDTSQSWNSPVFASRDAYKAGMPNRNALQISDPKVTFYKSQIGIKAALGVPGDSASAAVTAFIDTTMDQGNRKISGLTWEFDAQTTFDRLRDTKQCKTLSTSTTGATAVGHF